MEALAAHPQRQDVRLLAAVLRTGEHVCALRQRSHDEDHLVGTGTETLQGSSQRSWQPSTFFHPVDNPAKTHL